MRKDLDDKLVSTYPDLYKERHLSGEVTRMCDGFPGVGWYDIINRLSEKLTKLIALEKHPEDFYCKQAKEKFGTLRFYMSESTEEMGRCIAQAEEESSVTCEKCGKEGRRCNPSGFWLHTLCVECEYKIKMDVIKPLTPGQWIYEEDQ